MRCLAKGAGRAVAAGAIQGRKVRTLQGSEPANGGASETISDIRFRIFDLKPRAAIHFGRRQVQQRRDQPTGWVWDFKFEI